MNKFKEINVDQDLAKITGGWQGRGYMFVQAFKHKKSGFGKGFFEELTSGLRP